MRTGRDGTLELTYCTNIHPGESLDEVEANLRSHTVAVKQQIAPGKAMGVGLRLSNQAASELMEDEARLERFRQGFGDHDLYVFTLNGFPYGSFHRERVKDHVYRPDWQTDERVWYTERLVEVLAQLLPPPAEGSISTSPLSYKPWLGSESESNAALHAGALRLATIAFGLFDRQQRGGPLIHLGIEPEPDCLIGNTAETVAFFEEWLLRHGTDHLVCKHGLSAAQAEAALREHIRVCYDTCHFAVEFETPEAALSAFARSGIHLGKIQLSAALRVPLDQIPRRTWVEVLEPFAESTYLHQVVARSGGGHLHRYADLPEALPHLMHDRAQEWRIHYHVPIFVDRFGDLRSTQGDITTTLDRVLADGSCRHLEIETYTWEVLPPRLKTEIVPSIVREYEWVLPHLNPSTAQDVNLCTT